MKPNGNNVYILGAGFSSAANIPLASTFLARMKDLNETPSDLPTGGANALATIIKERATLANVRDKLNLNLDNIEELFSLIDANDNANSHDEQRHEQRTRSA